MRYQAFRRISTGEFVNAIFEIAEGSFDAAQTESRRLDIAAATGIPEGDIEPVEQATKPDASRGTLVLPITPATPQENAHARALAAIETNKDTAPWGRILYDMAVADGRIKV
jgi:hypothetical protein